MTSTGDLPIVFIFGCTGTGKSDLGVEIALKYNGEIVNSDSIQLYSALDIATNKITSNEMKGVPHHLLGYISPTETTCHIQEYRTRALEVISSIHSRGLLPIVVGGTSYYTEGLLYENNLISNEGTQGKDTASASSQGDEGDDTGDETTEYAALSNEELHERLKNVDPASAALVHPNNRRRVWRAIEIFLRTGRMKSELLAEQRKANAESLGRLRWSRSLLLYLDAPKEILDARLDARVVTMRTGGLRAEIEAFWKEFGGVLDSEKHGIMQCIGLKEFLPFLRLDPAKSAQFVIDQAFEKGVLLVQQHTRQYSTAQRKWIRNRFLTMQGKRQLPALAQLDATEKAAMFTAGIETVGRFLAGEEIVPPTAPPKTESSDDANVLLHCETCDRRITGRESFNKHIKSRGHRNILAARSRKIDPYRFNTIQKTEPINLSDSESQ